MNRFDGIINDEISKIINEVFEATLTPYTWNRSFEDGDYYYEFLTEDNDKYFVDVENDKYEGEDSWVISFTVGGRSYSDNINKGRIFKVMSTIIDIVKDFITLVKPNIITIIPSKANKDDNRRLHMYLAYFEKHFKSDYSVNIDYDLSNPEIIIRKK